MKKFLTWTFLITKRQLKNISFLCLLIAVPLLTAICSNIKSFKTENNETVLLYARDNDLTARRIIDDLLENKTEYIFQLVDSENELKESIKNRKALCGFIFDKNLTKQLKKERYNFNIISIVRESNTFTDAATEQVYSKYLKEIAYNLAIKIISESTNITEETYDINLHDLYQEIYIRDKDKFLQIEFLDEVPRNETLVANGVLLFSVPGVMAIIMLLGSLMGLGTWILDREKGTLSPIIRGKTLYARLIFISVPVVLLGISSLITISFSTSLYNSESFSFEQFLVFLRGVVVYGVLLIFLSLSLSPFVKKIEILIAIEVVLILGSLILCPVFFDVSGFIKPAIYLRLFMPVQWFLLLI